MISLAATSTSTRIAPETGDTKPADGGAKGRFSAVLAQHAPGTAKAEGENAAAKSGDETVTAARDEKAALVLPVGMAMPGAAKGGKTLPVELPLASDEADSEGKAEESWVAAAPVNAEGMAPAIVVPQLPLPAPQTLAEEEGGAEASTPARAVLPPQVLAARIAAARVTEPKTNEASGEASGGKPSGPAVALQVAPQAGPPATPGDTAMDGEAQGDAAVKAPKSAIERIAAQSAPAEAPRQPGMAIAEPPSSAAPAPAIDGGKPAVRTETLRELTEIVDRLAAAREAFAPAADALAIDHAEFGELSLRFDQRRDGSLSVQLSASNPDAHRAVAQAVGAQTFHSAADDRAGGQLQSQGGGQQQSLARGGAADREGASGGGAARHEQTAQQQRRHAAAERGGTGTPQRNGVFA